MRIAFDLDGVLADLQAVLAGAAERMFGASLEKVPSAAVGPAEAAQLVAAPAAASAADASGAAEATPATESGTAGEGTDDEPVPPLFHQLTNAQQRRLWRRVLETENFWETLDPTEPGVVGRLAMLALERRWEVLFITQRPASAGDTCQLQTQRWLARHGFAMPSVYVIRGSRGKVAAAFDLEVVVDDRPENCLDVVLESKARAFFVWRGDPAAPPAISAKRLNIEVVASVGECLDRLAEEHEERPGLLGRLTRMMRSGN